MIGPWEVDGIDTWKASTQAMIDWVEENLAGQEAETASLLPRMAQAVGYSPAYCSALFHRVTGITLRQYTARRRRSLAALALRDTQDRILDIALRYGYSSQEALTRAFLAAFGCTPHAYRRDPRPIPLTPRQAVLAPGDFRFGGYHMGNISDPNIRFEHLPAHRYIGIWEPRARNYGEFWQYHDCEAVCGVIDSMRHVAGEVVGSHMAGWYRHDGGQAYFYGFGVAPDYDGPVPEGFTLREFPASLYMVFFHPPFDYLQDNGEVMRRVEELAWHYDPAISDRFWIPDGYAYNEDACQAYQRHFPEVLGYEVLRPVKKIGQG